jgi:hypothetical protein
LHHDQQSAHEHGAVCHNCEALLAGAWCAHCGQKSSALNPTWHDVVHEWLHEILHLDGKIFQTLRTLFLAPGALTAEHNRGHRASYIGPLRLYLTMSVVFFVLTSVVPNPDAGGDSPQAATEHSAEAGGLPAGLAAMMPAGVVTGLRRADEHPEEFDELLSHTFQRLMFVLVPVFAGIVMVAYWRWRRNYPEFLYFSLHFHAAALGFFTLTVPLQALPNENWLKMAQLCALVGSFVYLVAALRRVFGGTRLATLLRASALVGAYVVVLLVSVATALLFSLYRLGSGAAH